MSHKHFCDFAGHTWECEGSALRPLAGDTEPSVCMCRTCQVPMEDGECTVGFCLWCGKDFCSTEEVEAHNADDMAACPAVQKYKGKH